MRIKIDFEMKIKIDIAVETVSPYYANTVRIKGIFFSRKRLEKKYPKSKAIRNFFIVDSWLFSVRLNEINGSELYIIKT